MNSPQKGADEMHRRKWLKAVGSGSATPAAL